MTEDTEKMSTPEQNKAQLSNIEKVDRVFKFAPFILLLPQLAGGILGGLCGAIGWQLNEYIFKREMPRSMKYLASTGCLLLMFGLYILVAAIFIAFFPQSSPDTVIN